jgi:DNA polymerase-3 subunit gamma/tau
MLTKEAFNALLKTLEEPPPHVVFVLATTELHKIPETITSRCQVFTYKKPTQEILKNLILRVAGEEGKILDTASAELIALLGDGSFRDALVMLQKVLSSAEGKKVSADEVERITGVPKNTLVNDFLSSINQENTPDALRVLQKVVEDNLDVGVFLKLVLLKLRAVMLLRLAPEMKTTLADGFTAEDFLFLQNFPVNKNLKLSEVLVSFLEASGAVSKSFIPSLPVELTIAKLFEEK